ncbi:DUF3396 domain-containing protein [Pyxidicoccus sp. QH1ED-7-1]|nr:DUF3396 domain-containing protein [Pyxidicoccus xibeiensis]
MDDSAWKRTRQAMLGGKWAFVTLADNVNIYQHRDFQFEYEGISREEPGQFDDPRRASVMSFWLPTEFLEQRGPGHTRALALELASHLPFDSGYASLVFDTFGKFVNVTRPLNKLCFRYPGVDVLEEHVSWDIGTRIPGAYWLTFLGPQVMGELGSDEALRARLSSPDTNLQQLPEDRAVVTLGTWPQAGDLEAGENLPEYRELARVLEPWLYHHNPEKLRHDDFKPADRLRWERRFLD